MSRLAKLPAIHHSFRAESGITGRDESIYEEKCVDGSEIADFYADVVGVDRHDKSDSFCHVCQIPITTSISDHEKSIVHQYAMHSDDVPNPTFCFIDPSNPGYKLLEKGGWNEKVGLGVQEQGRKQPIKTRLKRDRLGLGHVVARKMALRVTHSPVEVQKPIRVTRASEKREREKKRMKQERMRAEIYDFPIWPPE